MLHLAGLEVAPDIDGASLVPLLDDACCWQTWRLVRGDGGWTSGFDQAPAVAGGHGDGKSGAVTGTGTVLRWSGGTGAPAAGRPASTHS